MKYFQIIIASILFTLLGLSLHAQAGTSPSSINLQIVSFDSAQVSLSWTSPPGAVSCTLVYETQYDTTIYPLAQFSTGGTSIPRATPQGTWENFTIRFYMPVGAPGPPIVEDKMGIISEYGGIVLIVEEDVFCAEIYDECDALSGIEKIFFKHYDLVATKEVTCLIATEYEAMVGGLDDDEYGLHVLSFPFFMHDELTSILGEDLGDFGGVWGPEHLDEIGIDYVAPGGTREGSEALPTNTKAFPNPFTQNLRVTSDQQGMTTVKVRNMMGSVVFEQALDFADHPQGISINTDSWAAGIYFVETGAGKESDFVKIVKQ
ncbi:MAG: T9SS type A sorting domain-containing protein [Bacteroidia bacterium]